MYVLTAEQMRSADLRATQEARLPVAQLMERAGEGLAAAMRAHFEAPRGGRVVILCGRGNNGGDGMVAARHLKKSGSRVTVLLLGRGSELTGPGKLNWGKLAAAKVPRFEVGDEPELAGHARLIEDADLLVDAVLGTGSRGPLEGFIRAACRAMNASPAPVVAADIPTGVHGTSGAADPESVCATLTVTFAFPKFGHLLYPGRAHCGSVDVVDIGISEELLEASQRRCEVLTASQAAALLPRREPTAHKGDVGRIRIVGGSPGMLGAPALAARAALRAGSGLATVCCPRALYPGLAPLLLEATAALYEETEAYTHTFRSVETQLRDLEGCDALAVGPGLSRHHEAAQLAQLLVRRARPPMVLDADGLNAFEGLSELLSQHASPLVLTPHAGEFGRLAGLPRERVEQSRLDLAPEYAARWNAVVLLKGAPTVIAAPDGRIRLNPTGNAGMATGGSGDVLTGILTSYLGRGLAPFDAAALAAYVHGLSGDLARDEFGEEGLVAGDLVQHLPAAVRRLEAERSPAGACP